MDKYERLMKEIRRNNAGFLNKHITKNIKVQYQPVETQVIILKADYFKGYNIYFFEPNNLVERPF